MTRSLITSIFILLITGSAFSIETLPDAIVESDKTEYILSPSGKTIIRTYRKIKILKKAGAGWGAVDIMVNNNIKLKSFRAAVKDKNGKKVSSYSKSDLMTVSGYENYNLYSDARSKVLQTAYHEFPYEVEYEHEVERNNFMGTCWYAVHGYNLGVKYAELVVKAPQTLRLIHRMNMFDGETDSTVSGEEVVRKWTIRDVHPFQYEPYGPDYFDVLPSVYIVPENFRYAGYKGKNDTWENFGKWNWDLLQNRDNLSPETIAKVRSLTASDPDTLSKIKTLYKYLQSSTRYISIQIGIGGFQPFAASFVEDKKYGDCKALSNYMKSMLAAIGVKSEYCIIGSGSETKIRYEDFACASQANHAILMVPRQADTIWLECTSSYHPFGYIGLENGNRKALAVSDGAGKLVNTVRYGIEDNYKNTTAMLTLDNEGGIKGAVSFATSGKMMDDMIRIKAQENREQEQFIYELFPGKDLTVHNYDLKESGEMFPKVNLEVGLHEKKFSSLTGDFYTFIPNYFNRFNNHLSASEKRSNDIYIAYSHQKSDTIKYILPESFSPEYLPEAYVIESDFGTYRAEYKLSGNEFTYIRTFKLPEGQYPKNKYTAFYEFFNAVQTADHQKVIFKRR